MLLGDLHGLNTRDHQPAKLAAMEANWETQGRMPLLLFALPDESAEANRFEVAIPALGSVILTHDADGVVKGLKEWKPEDRPPVAIPFFSFRLMVGIGLAMLALTLCSWWVWARGELDRSRWFHKLCEIASPLGFVAVIAGWVTTEVGRQPWTVYGLLRTKDSVTPSLTGSGVLASLIVYIVAYVVIFGIGGFFMVRFLRVGPIDQAPDAGRRIQGTPARPMSAVEVE
jgi:cytochrome d ubiquinol oxidase subunit I